MTENEVLKDLQNYQGILKAKVRINASVNPEIALDAITEAIEVIQAYTANGTIEEFKALKEKSVAKKPNQVSKAMDKDKYVGLIGRCPNCGSIVAEDNLVCEDCFQVLDWSE